MNFTVIDFETANRERASACALGIVVVRNGKIVEKNAWFIRPKDNKFDGMNVAIHGIRPSDVENEPDFGTLYKDIFHDYLEGELVIAHNASFDISVMRASLTEAGIPFPNFDYLCTVKIGQKTWPDLYNHKLNTISEMLDFEFKHHDALDDCLACANALLEACKAKGCDSPLALAKFLKIGVGKLYPGGYKPCSLRKK